jgi:hypothetical protein
MPAKPCQQDCATQSRHCTNDAQIEALHDARFALPIRGGAGNCRRRSLPRGMEGLMVRMIKRSNILPAAVVCVALAAPAFAEDATPDSEHGRYNFSKVADGVLRLDTQTGEVSVCSQRTVGWACQATPDDRTVLESEIARLRSENAALKKEMLAHGLSLPGTGVGAPESSGAHDNDIVIHLPDDSEIDRAMAYAGDLWHRFVEAIARAQKQVLNNKS